MKKLWVVMQLKGEWMAPEDGGVVVEFGGVFDTKLKAVRACRDETYYMAPVELNKRFPHESVEFVDGYYPKLRGE